LAAPEFGSKGLYLFGAIGINIKLVPGDSAGTVTAYYVRFIRPPDLSRSFADRTQKSVEEIIQ
jgi:hypothetical protein